MSLSKERKVYLAIMGVGLAAVVLDRVALNSGISGPSSAAAGESLVVSPSPDQAPDPRAEVVAVAELLRLSSPAGPARDSFALPAAWIAAKSVESQTVVAEAPAASEKPKHRPALQLSGVLSTGGVVRAIVNGRVLTLGDPKPRDGMRLIEVGERSAVIEWRGERLSLVMDDEADESP